MSLNVDSLAAFRRFLAMPGATVHVTRHDWVNPLGAKPGFFDPRTVAKLQTNGVKFSTGSWLYWDSGASRFKFAGGDTVTVALGENFDAVMEYKLTIAGGAQ